MGRARVAVASAMVLAVLTIGGASDAAQALRVQLDQKGDFLLIGAPLAHDCALNTPVPIVGMVGACGSNTADHAMDIPWRSDSPAAGGAEANTGLTVANARSTAQLTIPAGSTVTHAFLYWAATLPAPGVDTTATISRLGGFTTSVTATTTYQSVNNSYMAVADITPIVQANGSGGYRVSDVNFVTPNDLNDPNLFAAWHMVVFYQDPAAPLKNLAIFDGFDSVNMASPQTVTLNGFLVPVAGSSAKLGVVTYEGDYQLTGDSLFVNPSVLPNPPAGEALTNAGNPANNFFNSSRTFFGNPVTTAGDLPQLSGAAQSMSGIDIDVVDIQAQVMPLDSQATIHASSTGDQYFLATFVTSFATFKPDFTTSTKSAVDLNGGALLPGDVVEYTVLVANTGNDTSVNTVIVDTIPTGVTYVPGTLQITGGANMGAKTDSAGDDQGDYSGATKTLTVRLGAGASAASGGTMLVAETSTINFQVTVDPNISGTISNQAVINGAGQQGWPDTATPTDGNGAGGGQPPTDIVVEQCVDDSGCAMPTPYCDVAAAPNICVECLSDAQCPGNAPTCSPATNTCVCVAGGAETCDGKDNDCDGLTDNGFGTGMACAVGVGVCQNIGTIVCTGLYTSGCSATPDEPQAETCNGLDDNCDNVVDDGFTIGMACSNGVGECAASGTITCDGLASASCDAVAGMPSVELCDGLDNDCDGNIDNNCLSDADADGISDAQEIAMGTNPNDPDTDDDGVVDGQEPNPSVDTDGDGVINALDPDSDNDGLLDGTEMGKDCTGAGTDVGAGRCVPDGDKGATTTDPLDKDSDGGGFTDGDEDFDKDGVCDVDQGESDPNEGADDISLIICDKDPDCPGTPNDGLICDGTSQQCLPGCRGVEGSGCPEGELCSSATDTLGECVPTVGPSSSGGGVIDTIHYNGCICEMARASDAGARWALVIAASGAAALRRRGRRARSAR